MAPAEVIQQLISNGYGKLSRTVILFNALKSIVKTLSNYHFFSQQERADTRPPNNSSFKHFSHQLLNFSLFINIVDIDKALD